MTGAARIARPVDLIVVGSGAAGMSAALGARSLDVAILTKTTTLAGGASALARGGVAAAVGPDDSAELHADDTLAAAAGGADPAVVREIVARGPGAIERLVRLGARFDRDLSGRFALAREAAHGRARVVRAGGDATGIEIVRVLSAALLEADWIELRAGVFAEDLLFEDGRVAGLIALDADGARAIHRARAVVLATGGIGRLFPATTNPQEATADGLAIAARAGAKLADLEFVQFHPTALDVARDPMPLITEALRGAGAALVDGRGRRILLDGYDRAELAPRDVVAREIVARIAKGERVALDARELGSRRLESEFPGLVATCAAVGLDPAHDLLPVSPAAHYHMGGVAVDATGEASVPGLYACGEVAGTGMHGANRLASNSLLEALVCGARVGAGARAELGRVSRREAGHRTAPPPHRCGPGVPWRVPHRVEVRLRAAVGRGLGVVRDGHEISDTLNALADLAAEAVTGEARNMLLVARLIACCALAREESRGAHRRRDFPRDDPSCASRRVRDAAEILAEVGAPALT